MTVPSELWECASPQLIGVRHHSPACAAAMHTLLDARQPERIFLELPPELSSWLPWLGHADLTPPVALAAAEPGGGLSFYPFAVFSPELQAVRWAVQHNVPVIAFDAPLSGRPPRDAETGDDRLVERLSTQFGVSDVGALWDRMVEAPAPGQPAESIRRAALSFGWVLRADHVRRSHRDELREAHMRHALDTHGRHNAVAIIGSYHAAALLPEPLLWDPPNTPLAPPEPRTVTSLVPYSEALLDARSGYPAGIRDPALRARLFRALSPGSPQSVDDIVADAIVSICRRVRKNGHVAGVPDAAEALRLARDLAVLRGLPAPGRTELLESLQSALSRGEGVGRNRVLARAMEPVLVGERTGRLAPGTPRSGLLPHVEGLTQQLGLPGPQSSRTPTDLRLDVLRSPKDRRREVMLQRLSLAGVAYATPTHTRAAGGIETLTRRWSVAWTPSTTASLAVASGRGVTLVQAAQGALLARKKRLVDTESWTAAARLSWTADAAEAGLLAATRSGLEDLAGAFVLEAGLPELVGAFALVGRLERGHVAALPVHTRHTVPGEIDALQMPDGVHPALFLAAAVAAVEGLAGSEQLDDVTALLEVVAALQHQPEDGPVVGTARLEAAIHHLTVDGSPLMQGAGAAVAVQLQMLEAHHFARRLGSWTDHPDRSLSLRLQGALVAAGPLLTSSATLLEPLALRIEALPDAEFLARLPALRQGFHVLAPHARDTFLRAVALRHDRRHTDLLAPLALSALHLGRLTVADAEGLAAAEAFGWTPTTALASTVANTPTTPSSHRLSAADRWRLVLGRQRDKLQGRARRLGRALDELYGDPPTGGGQEPGFPTVREWAEELHALFGERVREEVLGQAIGAGRAAAAFELDAQSVRPSVELLQQILGLKGSLSESQLGRLRPLVARIVEALAKALAVRVRPALTGVAMPRPTRRPGGPLDLPRTLRANLHTLQASPDGPFIVPERLVFQSRGRRSMDWHVVVVVDVSGSMEPSTVYAALMSAILAAAPWIHVSFLSFNTEVVDLGEHATDPLRLLLEVRVGGGTHIAKALRHARTLVRVPRRTIVLVITDFEEGFSVDGLLAEVRALVATGARCLGLAALDDAGSARYSKAIASQVVAAGMPVAALSPLELARWVGDQING